MPRPFGVRKLYLPWEVGKPPDWVLEVASSSTGAEDVGRKRDLYARIGVPEYWRFDPQGWRVSRGAAGRGPAGGRAVCAYRVEHGAGRHA